LLTFFGQGAAATFQRWRAQLDHLLWSGAPADANRHADRRYDWVWCLGRQGNSSAIGVWAAKEVESATLVVAAFRSVTGHLPRAFPPIKRRSNYRERCSGVD